MEDRFLIKRCKQGDSQALRCIYQQHREALVVLAVALTGDVHAAEDVLHDVFFKFARGLDRFVLTGKLKAYLSVCVANEARNHHKRTRVRCADDIDQVDLEAGQEINPVQRAIGNEQLGLISEALVQIPMDQRGVIALHLHTGLTFREIAQQLGDPVPTIKSRYRYGIAKLRSILGQEVTS